MIEAVALTDFVDGKIKAVRDRPLMLDEGIANRLEKRGLVRIKAAPGKQAVAGEAQQSSSLPAAPVSPRTTLHLPGAGKGKRKTGM